jgi:hypothetical protein
MFSGGSMGWEKYGEEMEPDVVRIEYRLQKRWRWEEKWRWCK